MKMTKKYKIDASGALMPELSIQLSGTEAKYEDLPKDEIPKPGTLVSTDLPSYKSIPDDELFRKSKQLSRLTTERFARIEDRLDKLEEDIILTQDTIGNMKANIKGTQDNIQSIKELLIKAKIIVDDMS